MGDTKIPKVIHYCWFGKNPLPEVLEKCLQSWKKYCPHYEIKLWTEENFDVNIIPYCKQAYKQGKYAFVSDYARLYILYHFGGIYLDIDVEMIKNIDDLLDNDCFMGFEEGGKVAPGLIIGAAKENSIIKNIMKIYEAFGSLPSKEHDICKITTKYLRENKELKSNNQLQILDGITVYPKDYFCASDWVSQKINITENTYCIHHYCGSWMNRWQKLKKLIRKKIRNLLCK